LVWKVVSATVIEAVTDDANAMPILRVTLSNVTGTGAHYDVELRGQIDHPVTDNPDTGVVETAFEDDLLIDIGYTVTDNDDDAASAVLTVTVDDDGPSVTAAVTDGDTVKLTTQDADTIGAANDTDTANFGRRGVTA
jgi:hypothetical protein